MVLASVITIPHANFELPIPGASERAIEMDAEVGSYTESTAISETVLQEVITNTECKPEHTVSERWGRETEETGDPSIARSLHECNSLLK